MIVRVSVRNLVEFILRSGNIDNRRRNSSEKAIVEGGRIHRMIQRKMGSNYQAEVTLKYKYIANRIDTSIPLMNAEVQEKLQYEILLEGRADGVIENEQYVIDEIKGTYRDISKMKDANPVHVAQAKCYAYMYGVGHNCQTMGIRMTYCNIDTEKIRYFYYTYQMDELEIWFLNLMAEYQKWTDLEIDWKQIRQQSLKMLSFPFDYRSGQKELVTYVYQTIYHKRKLFIEAPTGVGKTISTIFPAIKSMGKGYGDKLFYFTAKTITRTVAEDTFSLLRDGGLRFRTVTLTAKEKICFLEEVLCNPDACPYAKGHMDRINEALYHLLTSVECVNRSVIEEYALKYKVCPFELGLDATLFADGIIGDYNYLFDPHVYLKRFFANKDNGEHIFLIDEAHNLIDRGREMYSAILCKEDFLKLKKVIKPYDSDMEKRLETCNRDLLYLKRNCESYQVLDEIDKFILSLNRLAGVMEKYLEKHDGGNVREDVLDFYFIISHFLLIYDKLDDKYLIYSELQSNGDFIIKLLCVDPSTNLRECMEWGRSSVLFSATLLPIQYYKRLLGGREDDYEVYAHSTFQPQKKLLLVANDVTSKYTRRSEMEFYNIAKYIEAIVSKRHGNYMIFCPSHQFMRNIYQIFVQYFMVEEREECVIQEEYMREEEREQFLNRFMGNPHISFEEVLGMEVETEDKSLIGFCVLGGIFSEGIDLKNDSLIGAIIVGTGLPQVCTEKELLKQYFDKRNENGFDYAYKFPGMNKVLQSAGRVIRTKDDIGIIALLDERFLTPAYLEMFPRDWSEYEIIKSDTIGRKVERFWDEWL